MGAMASQITDLTIVYSTVHSGADQRKYLNSASLAFVRVIHRSPMSSPHKWPVTRKMFPFDDVIIPPSHLLQKFLHQRLARRLSWWRYRMETFFALLAFCAGNLTVTSEFPSQKSVTRSFDVLICAWTNGSVNNREAGDLRRNRGHYDVTVM